MNYQLSKHARDALDERQIPVYWMERALNNAALVVPSTANAALESRLLPIAEFGNRVLRVVINKDATPIRVISVYFDRAMKGKL